MTDDDSPARVALTGEPALEDLIADPIVRAVMRVDGLVEADLRDALVRARRALEGRIAA